MPTAVTEDGVDIAWHDFGGRGPELLLAHATGFHAHAWLPVVERLGRHFRCVAFDERGHGDSGRPADGVFAWRGFALDTLAVVQAAGLTQPYGVGHSCGGAAVLMAEQDEPGMFRALYCYEPVIAPVDDPPPPSADNPLAAGARRRREVFPTRDDALARYSSKPPFAGFAAEALEAYVAWGFDDLPDGTVRLKCRGEDEARVYQHGFSHDTFSRLGRVGCPVTVAYGEHTAAMGAGVCEPVAARLPNGRSEVQPGLTHFGPLEDPDAVAAAVVRAFTA